MAGYRKAFDVPGLTGVWAYRQEGKPVSWCATVITARGVFDTEEHNSPWAALAAAAELVEGE